MKELNVVNLINLANKLDREGRFAEANFTDSLLKKIAGIEEASNTDIQDHVNHEEIVWKLAVIKFLEHIHNIAKISDDLTSSSEYQAAVNALASASTPELASVISDAIQAEPNPDQWVDVADEAFSSFMQDHEEEDMSSQDALFEDHEEGTSPIDDDTYLPSELDEY